MLNLSNKKILIIIAPTNFKDEEYYIPKEIFEKSNINVKTASLSSEATSVNGKTQSIDVLLNQATTDYDAIVFVGGPGATIYLNNSQAHKLAQNFFKAGKLTTAICIAPSILANAGILKGKKATVFPTEANNLKEKGATYTGKSVTVDGKIVKHKNNDCRGQEYCLGLITFNVPEGRHLIKAQLTDTQIRSIGNIITLISFIIICLLIGKNYGYIHKKSNP